MQGSGRGIKLNLSGFGDVMSNDMTDEYPKYTPVNSEEEALPDGVKVFNRDGTVNVEATEKLLKIMEAQQAEMFGEMNGFADLKL